MHNIHNKVDRVMSAIENSCLLIYLPQIKKKKKKKKEFSLWVKDTTHREKVP